MQFQRLALNIGNEALQNLHTKTVLVVGVGGVGGFAIEALARCGIGTLIIVDNDIVDITNLNRQIIALHSTIGQNKVDVMESRIKDINPNCNIVKYNLFYDNDTADEIFSGNIDFVIDACDTVSAKFDIIKRCLENQIMFVSAMGAANKIDPSNFQISTLDKTSYDPLAKVLRKKYKDEHLKGKVPVVFSMEKPSKQKTLEKVGLTRKQKFPPSSNAYTPSVSGLVCASFVINSLVANKYVFKNI